MKTVGNKWRAVLIFAAFAAIFASCEQPVDPGQSGHSAGGATYTVHYDANGGTGTMEYSYFARDTAQALKNCAFYRTGFGFMGWATSPDGPVVYTKEQSVSNLAAAGETVTLYAVWEIFTYAFRVIFNANGGTGTMPDAGFVIYDSIEKTIYPEKLPVNTFTRTGYYFMGWATSPDGAVDAAGYASYDYYDQYPVKNLFGAGETLALYAVWNAQSYTIEYNANGGSGPIMLNQWFTYDEAQNLRPNTFTRKDTAYPDTNYVFIGWATSPDGPVAYTDEQSVINLSAGEGVRLYAVWRTGSYTVAYDANGGSGTMSSQHFAYGVPQFLAENTFFRYGHTFAGWAASPDGAVAYTDRQSVNNLTETAGETMTLYAAWALRPDAWFVSYDANGGSGTMADSVFAADEPQSLRPNAFTKTGYTMEGWATSPDGAKAYNNGHYVYDDLVTAGQTLALYAVWKANTYSVVFNINTGGWGQTESTTHTYDKEQTLRKNTYTRTGYVFKGWARTSTATTVEYTDEQSVINLSATANGTFTLYAVWANIYTVHYNKNATDAVGSMDSQSFIYGEAQDLRINAYTRTGYTFMGWATSSLGLVAHTDGQNVNNLITTANGTVNLYAVWRNNYTVHYNKNAADAAGSMEGSAFIYGTAQNLQDNAFTRAGYAFMGWAESETGTVKYANGQSVNNLTTTANGIFTLYAVWDAGAYTIAYDANGGSGSMSSHGLTFDVTINLPTNVFTRAGYTFAGWSMSPDVAAQYADEQSVSGLTTTAGATVTLYAMWSYTVIYNRSGGNGTMENSTFTCGVAQNLRPNAYTLTGYTFMGWATSPGGPVVYSDGQSVENLIPEANGTITLYVKWQVNTFTVTYDANGGSGAMEDSAFTYNVVQNLRTNTFTRTNYRFTGWSQSPDATTAQYTDRQSFNNEITTPNAVVTLYAVWSNTYTVIYNKNATDAVGIMADSTFIYGVPQTLSKNTFTRPGYTFGGWSRSLSYEDEANVTFSPSDGATITMNAQWWPNYTIKYDANGGAGGPMSNQNFVYATPQNLRLNVFTRAHATFAGWSTYSSGPVQFTDGQSITSPYSSSIPSPNAIITLYAIWDIDNYTVVYNANATTGVTGTMANSAFPYDAERTLSMNQFTRSGHRFLGWSTSSTATSPAYTNGQTVRNLPVAANETVTLYAVWTNTYTVTFNANGGSGTMSDQSFVYGTAQNLLNNIYITRTGHTFAGWARTSDATTAQYTNGQSVNNLATTSEATVTLYAVWNVNTYTVVYDANGGGGTAMPSQSFTYGVTQNLRTNTFTRTDYTFAGWATSSDATTVQYNNGAIGSSMPASSGATVTLYAVWRNNYTVVFNKNSVNATGTMSDQNFVYGTAQNLRPNSFTLSGYTFMGWTRTSGGTVQFVNEASVNNLTTTAGEIINLYAVWSRICTVVFNKNAADATGTMNNQSFTIGVAQPLTQNQFTRTNYTFVGWSTSAGYNAEYTNGQSATMNSAGTVTLYAIWRSTYTVVFNANATSGVTGTMNNQSFTYDKAQNLSQNQFTRAGYAFQGWATSAGGAVEYANQASVNNLTATPGGTFNLYAVWRSTYTVVFNANGGTAGTGMPMNDQIFVYGTPKNLITNSFIRTGYRFQGWTTSPNGAGEFYADKASVNNLTATPGGTVNLYAFWTPNTYTVKYNKNAPLLSPVVNGTMNDQGFTYDSAQKLRSNAFTCSGYTFRGWSTSWLVSTVTYTDGQSVINLTPDHQDTVNLYAVWERN